ncbi:hypothetical protein ABZM74_000989 [Weissella confusa]
MILLLIINIVVIAFSSLIGYRILSRLLVDNLNKSEQLIQLKLIQSLLKSKNDDLTRVAGEMKNLIR